MTRTVAVLGVVQILTWGSSFYLLAVLAAPIHDATGWPLRWVAGGVSCGLLASGLAARRIGGIIATGGGRRVLATGCLLLAAGLAVVGLSQSLPVYLLGWLVIGCGMGASLYDAAFSVLGRLYGTATRRAITQLTLWGGFASTVCWPLTAVLADTLGWRGACLAYAAVHLCVTAPLCRFALPPVPAVAPPAAGQGQPSAEGAGDPRFWLIALAGVTMTMLSSLLSIHLFAFLAERGLTLAQAVAVGALIGPAQVGARLVEMLGRGRHHAVWTMAISTALVAVGLVGLAVGLPAAAVLVAFGAGNGLWSIARGTLPMEVFGPDAYPRVMGRLATPVLLASAAAPLLGAVLIVRLGAGGAQVLLACAALVPPCAAAGVVVLTRRERASRV
ncbi:MFS transporter [Oceaniglobus roseus]|uniref:MFS transporter n=1 Tax=Oceaniglobus roseus TaxID=1737570 RepID=UPI000C7F64F7|nr:MFS transporter [Kandeliimicrobium roseum]